MTGTFVPQHAALCLNLERTPPRACYEGLTPEEKQRIELVLDKYKVQTFKGFNYWSFERGGDFIAVRKLSWKLPRFEKSVDDVVEFLHDYHKPSLSIKTRERAS